MAGHEQIKYGAIKNEDSAVKIPFPLAASEVIKAKSGRFVTLNAGNLEVADDGDTLLIGWAEFPEGTTASGDIATFLPAWGALGVVFRIPVNAGTFVAAMRGKTCDLARSSSIQGAKLDASGEDNLIIVDGDLESNLWVDVMFNPSKLTGFTGVV